VCIGSDSETNKVLQYWVARSLAEAAYSVTVNIFDESATG